MGDHKGGAGRNGRPAKTTPPVRTPDYVGFENDTDAYSFMDAAYRQQTDKLSAADVEALQEWSLAGYDVINNYLRGKISRPVEDDYEGGRDRSAVLEAMDRVFKSGDTILRHDLVTQRSFGSYYQEIKSLAVGDIITDKGFAPVSVNPHRIHWGSPNENVKIQVPAGTKGLWLRPISEFPEEGELLLKRGTSFRVVSTNRDSAGIVLEVIGQA